MVERRHFPKILHSPRMRRIIIFSLVEDNAVPSVPFVILLVGVYGEKVVAPADFGAGKEGGEVVGEVFAEAVVDGVGADVVEATVEVAKGEDGVGDGEILGADEVEFGGVLSVVVSDVG